MFQIRNVTKKFGDEYALNDVSLNIEKGINFIIGSSGSGKTTLLKIISGFDTDYEGEVSFFQKDIKSLSKHEKSYLYNNIFGFVWQDFNLLENLTAEENILFPQQIKSNNSRNKADKIMQELEILDLRNKKVKLLSGGQKQRVAIARELMKTPDVILCDEPTSALDEKTAKTTMDILRKIARLKTVIIVTHDTSLVKTGDHVITLDKGELEKNSVAVANIKTTKLKLGAPPKLKFLASNSMALTSFKRNISRVAICALVVLVSTVLMLTSLSGTINNTGKKQFSELLSKYGNSVLDVKIHNGFMSASGTGGGTSDKPNVDIDQDINGLFYKYENDSRVDFTLISQYFNSITIDSNGKTFSVPQSSNVPVFSGLINGRYPKNDAYEVMVPKEFPKLIGFDNSSVLGQKIKFNCTLTKWVDKTTPTFVPTSVELEIVGVFDSTATVHRDDGTTFTFDVTDAFFMSAKPTRELRSNIGLDGDSLSFILRAKTPKDMISLKNEFNKDGIVPLGEFEKIEDIVKLEEMTANSTSQATIIITILSAVLAFAVFAITAMLRLKEYAIYKLCGFSNSNITMLTFTESLHHFTYCAVLLIMLSPIWNLLTKLLFNVPILNFASIFIGVALICGLEFVSCLLSILFARISNTNATLKGGSR